jgi:sugar lactone lactonase YvrE
MKQKYIIVLTVVLLVLVVGLMVWDFYYKDQSASNPYEYRIEEFKTIDPAELCYQKAGHFRPEIKNARAIALDKNDWIYLAGEDQVAIFDTGHEEVAAFAIPGQALCMAIADDHRIYLGSKNRILVYDTSGILLRSWNVSGKEAWLSSIVVDGQSVFVADAGNKIVYHFNNTGVLLNRIGEKNAEDGFQGFVIPSPHFDVALGREGQLWVVNPGKHQLLAFNKAGALFSSWEKTSMQAEGFSGCCNPGNIALLGNGSFVTSEKGIERVKIHLPNGDYQCMVADPDSFESGTDHLDLAVNANDRIYVLDAKSGMVHFFDAKVEEGLQP